MSRDEHQRLLDLLDALTVIRDYAGGTFEDATFDEPIELDAVLLRLLVIGEAAKHVGDDLRHTAPGVPWSQYARLRDVIAHQYFHLQQDIIENTVRRDLPVLLGAVRELLGDGDS